MSTMQYFEGRWNHTAPEEPIRFHYEVDSDGNVVRLVEVYVDGRMVADSLSSHPDGATPFGFGTLIGCSFDELEIGSRADLGKAEFSLAPVDPAEFEAVWEEAI
ncbi:MAG: DUF6881 domain-containing protein [Erythrobacter sp.]|uniref:DUF6881 domain-containing protein n=1 Tax=Erythrobacter sp. TaxID=1042 RepID=UPI003A87286F